MGVLLTFRVPARSVSLGDAAETAGANVTLDPLVHFETGIPSVRVRASSDTDYGEFERAIREFETVEDVGLLEDDDDSRTYAVSWSGPPGGVFEDLHGTGAHVLSADGNGDAWRFETAFQSEADLAAFSERCRSAEVPLEVESIQKGAFAREDTYGLTEDQYETLLLAVEEGFYDVPRETNTVELAAELGISDQSLSERLRRAHATLVENTLM